MDTSVINDLLRDGVVVVIKLVGPMLLLSMVVGILIAIFQAVTQIHEQSLAFVLKIIVILAVLVLGGSWMMEQLVEYCRYIFELIAS